MGIATTTVASVATRLIHVLLEQRKDVAPGERTGLGVRELGHADIPEASGDDGDADQRLDDVANSADAESGLDGVRCGS